MSVPRNLCALLPNDVPFEHGAFGVLGALALQGVRLAELGLGDIAFVLGLGLVGQLVVGLLTAAGCRVIGTDLDPRRCDLALRMGAELARPGLGAADTAVVTGGRGADAVLVAAATPSSGPIELAAELVRKKGRVVVIGAVGMEIPRTPYYLKEAEIVVSCSYGPGRYDPLYEERGHDYPAAYVRWTEQRNLQAVLDLMGSGRLDVEPLISHRFAVTDAERAYQLIDQGNEPFLGVVLTYPGEITAPRSLPAPAAAGAGGRRPRRRSVDRHRRLRPGGADAGHRGVRPAASGAVVLGARSDGRRCRRALRLSRRHQRRRRSVDRPPRRGGLHRTRHDLQPSGGAGVGCGQTRFRREAAGVDPGRDGAGGGGAGGCRRGQTAADGRLQSTLSPAAEAVREFFADVAAPLTVSVRFNAGPIDVGHWTQDSEVGGGRIVGEACHAIDLATYLCDSPPVRVFAESVGGGEAPAVTEDQFSSPFATPMARCRASPTSPVATGPSRRSGSRSSAAAGWR